MQIPWSPACYGRSLPHFPTDYGCYLSIFCALPCTALWNITPPSLSYKLAWAPQGEPPMDQQCLVHSLGTWKQFLHWGSIIAGSSAATHRQERTQFAPLGSALLRLAGCSVYSYATAKVCFKAGTKARFPQQLYDTAHHPERHVAYYPNEWLESSHDDRLRSSLHRCDKRELQCPGYVLETPQPRGGALDERCEPCPSQEGGRGRREHQSGGLAHHHCRVRRARQTGPASRHGDEAGRAAGVGRLAAHGDLAGARPLGQHCFETAAAVAVPGPRQRRRLVQAGSQPG